MKYVMVNYNNGRILTINGKQISDDRRRMFGTLEALRNHRRIPNGVRIAIMG